MRGLWGRATAVAALVAWATSAFAQGAQSGAALQGVVTADGGAVTGALVTVRSTTGNAVYRTETDSKGAFDVRLTPGTYGVTITSNGFRSATVPNVVVAANGTPPLQVKLEADRIARPLLPAATTRVETDKVLPLPLVTHNALDFVTFLPGVETPGINRRSTISGLPQSAIGITWDGINIQDPATKSQDAFFAVVTPRIDAVAELTLTSAGAPADDTAHGAGLMAFVTRSGSSMFTGTGYQSFRASGLGSNSFFNDASGLDKNGGSFNQFGVSEGGPIGRGGAGTTPGTFFFMNYEDARFSGEVTRSFDVLGASARTGVFQYRTAAGLQSVPLLTLAAANGQVATADATVQSLLTKIQTSTSQGRIISTNDPNVDRFVVQNDFKRREHQPTFRVDHNLGGGRLSGSYTYLSAASEPDVAAGVDAPFTNLGSNPFLDSTYQVGQITWRAPFASRWTNEFRTGRSWGTSSFGDNIASSDFASGDGFALGLPLVTSPSAAATGVSRDTTLWTIDDTVYLRVRSHRFAFGVSFLRSEATVTSRPVAQVVSLGLATSDPAAAMFTAAAFPGASAADVDAARGLYGLVTGRVIGISEPLGLNAATNRYDFLGATSAGVRQDVLSLLASDEWRAAPNVTLSYGLRWDLQQPMTPVSGLFATSSLASACGISGISASGQGCNLFAPNAARGEAPKFDALATGATTYSKDVSNLAPSGGLAWKPFVETGLFRRIFGDPQEAMFYGAYSVAYNRNGLLEFTSLVGANPGGRVAIERSEASGNLLPAGGTLPLLLRNRAQLATLPACAANAVTPNCQPTAPAFPVGAVAGQSVNIFDPNIDTPFTRSWVGGLQRSLGPDHVVDVRWVSTREERSWVTDNFNELNPLENNWIDEFRFAQANLQANLAAGRGATFAYFGPGTGTAPLPAYLMFFSGLAETSASNAANYSSANFADRLFLARLATNDPDPIGALQDLWGNAAFRANAVTAGMPAARYVMNPALGTGAVNVTRNGGPAQYDALQFEVRRRLVHGFEFAASYTESHAWMSVLDTLHFGRYQTRSPLSVPHAFKMTWSAQYSGWTFNGTARIQSGRAVSASGVRLVNMSVEDLQNEFQVRSSGGVVTMLPDEIILNTRRAFNVDPTSATGYSALGVPVGRFIAPASSSSCIELYPGDCGEPRRIILRGPVVARVDFNVGRTIVKKQKLALDVRFDMLNLLNRADVVPVFNPGASATIFQVTSGFQDVGNTSDSGGRLGQIVWRLRW